MGRLWDQEFEKRLAEIPNIPEIEAAILDIIEREREADPAGILMIEFTDAKYGLSFPGLHLSLVLRRLRRNCGIAYRWKLTGLSSASMIFY